MKKKVRKKYIVNKKAQYTFITILFLWFITTTALISYFIMFNIGTLKKFLPDNPDSVKMISDFSMRSWMVFGVYLLSFLLLTIILGYYTSNRVFGPIYRLNIHINENLENKSLEPVQFRKNDEFQFLAHTYNELIENVKLIDNDNPSQKD